MIKKLFILTVGFVFITLHPISAVTKIFTGTGHWSDTFHWDNGTVPSAGDDVVINGNCLVTSDVACAAISVWNSCTLVAVDHSLTVTGNATTSLGGVLAVSQQNGGSVTYGSYSGSSIINNAFVFYGGYNWNLAGSWYGGKQPAASSSNVVMVNNGLVYSTALSFDNLSICNGAIFEIDNNSATISSLTVTGTLTLNGPGCLKLHPAIYLDALDIVSNGGTAEMDLNISGGWWHYASNPTSSNAPIYGTAYNFEEGKSNNWNNCWVLATDFVPGTAQAVETSAGSGGVDAVSIGIPNHSDISVPVKNSGVMSTLNYDGSAPYNVAAGWNLIGNPYPTGLGVTQFIANNTAKLSAGHKAYTYGKILATCLLQVEVLRHMVEMGQITL